MSAKYSSEVLISAVDAAVVNVRTRTLDVSFNEIMNMHGDNELVIEPDFQRLFRWSDVRQSQFIESLILELPIPPVYVAEVEDGVYELIDGLQRISSYLRFRGKLPSATEPLVLSGCDLLEQLNGAMFNDLPSSIQIKLKRAFVRMEVLRRETSPKLRYYMFKRLNTGGELLSDQEIRNCTIRLLGTEFNDFIKELAKNPNFLKCTEELSEAQRDQMGLEEMVLRFFALKNARETYDKIISEFLTDYMEAVSDPDRSDVGFDYEGERRLFDRTFELLGTALYPGVFSGYNPQGTARGYFSTLHFEAYTIGIQEALDRITPELEADVAKTLRETKTDEVFATMTTGGGKNYAAALRKRIAFVQDKVESCLV